MGMLICLFSNSNKSTQELRPPPSVDPDDLDSDPEYSQNLITCSLSNLGHFLKMSNPSITFCVICL